MKISYNLIFLLLFVGCVPQQPIVIHKPYIHDFSCPEIIIPVFEKHSINNSEEENLLIELNNKAMIVRIVENLRNIIDCYRENIELIRKEMDNEH